LSFGAGDNYKYTRIFPFYSNEQRYGITESTYLWPILKTRNEYIKDNGKKLKSIYIFPVYGEENTRSGRYKSYLYPLIKYKVGDINSYFSVFPVYEGQRSKDLIKDSVFFLWGRNITAASERRYYLYPLGEIYKNHNTGDYKISALPFYKHSAKSEHSATQIFPVLKIKRQTANANNLEWHFPAPDLFLTDTKFEKNYARFWRLANYRRTGTEIKFDFLYCLMEYEKNADFTRYSLFPLFTVLSKNNKTDVNILFDLIKI